MKGRTMKNIPGTIRAIDLGNGICELRKDPDVLTIIPVRKKRNTRLLFAIGTAAIFAGAAVAMLILAPAFSTLLFAVVAWCGFAAASGKEENT